MNLCFVPGCSSQEHQTPDIKFHQFPNREHDKKRFEEWTELLRINREKASKRKAAVCSLHFTEEIKVMGELTDNALPNQNLPTEQIDQSTELQRPLKIGPRILYCRLCANPKHKLDTIDLHDANFFHPNQTNVFQFLLSFLEISEEDALPTSICRVCACKLNETLRFKADCTKAAAKLKAQRFDTVDNMLTTHEEIKKEPVGNFEFIGTYAGVQTDDSPLVDDEDSPTNGTHMDPSFSEEEPMIIEIENELEPFLSLNEPRWKCLLCKRFTASKSEVKRHYPKCKSFHNRFVKNKHVVKTEKKKNLKNLSQKSQDRRKSSFNIKMQAEFPYLKLYKPDSKSDVNCELCGASFSVEYKGRGSVRSHLETAKHQKAVRDKDKADKNL